MSGKAGVPGTNEDKYRSLVENANSIILRWDTKGNIVFLNEFGQRFFGFSEEEIIGRNVMDTIVPPMEITGRDLARMIENLCSNPDQYMYNENENIRKNGERVWVAWANKAVLDEVSKPVEILSVGTDITARKKAEAELERRADELQTLLSVQQAITSRLDLDDVLQLIADEARRLTFAKRAAVFLKEDDFLRIAVFSGESAPDMLGYRMPIKNSLTGESLYTGIPVRVTDIKAVPNINQEIITKAGVQSFISVPLRSGKVPIGAIAVVDKQQGQFSPDDERILVMLASGAVIGLENARLYGEKQKRRQEDEKHRQVAEGLRDILAILNSNRPLPEILDFILSQAGRMMGTDTGAFYRLQPDKGLLSIEAARGLPGEYIAEMSVPVGEFAVGRAVMEKQAVVVPDLTRVLPKDLEKRPEPQAKPLAWLMTRYRSIIAVPLEGRNKIYGGIVLYFPETRIFAPHEIDLVMSFAAQATLAIENANLRIQAEEAAVAAERSRLARDLHDAVTQTLFSASLIAEVLPRLWEKNPEEGKRRLQEIRELSRGALAEMRALLLELRPSTLAEIPLEDLIKQLTEALNGRTRIPIDVTIESHYGLPADVKIAFYRITQEALNNIAKHSRASRASLCLYSAQGDSPGTDTVLLSIRDNGQGFITDQISPEHLGLNIMRERAASIGARLDIKSRPGHGTEVTVGWNNRKEAKAQ